MRVKSEMRKDPQWILLDYDEQLELLDKQEGTNENYTKGKNT